MLDPEELLRTARQLQQLEPTTDANLRRAISTAYYAVFHTVLHSAGDLLVGDHARGTGAYSTLYRGFTHRRIADVCKELQKANLKLDVRQALGRQTVSPATQAFAWRFYELQTQRHAADYNPVERETIASTAEVLLLARSTMDHWAGIPRDERRDILALMLVAPHR